ncbi:ATP-binding cassette sub-family C member 4-like [Centruroides vittatus]|uniref:ATP-binding cassette sub-family C member 4-like n=1 Tax=Centruroides vittatus TaxID=120091 RepID=UPI00350F052E
MNKYLSCSWIFPLINRGRKRVLKEEDLYESSKYHTSEYLGNLLQKEWDIELQKTNSSVLKAVLRFLGWQYLLILFLVLIQETAVVAGQAYLLGLTIHYFNNRLEWNQYNAYATIAGFFGLTAIYVFTFNTNYFITDLYGMKLKVAFCNVVYKKALRLNSSALEKSNVGQMVNLLANDVSKFHNKICWISYLLTNPFLIIITISMLWKYYGWTIFVGFLAVFLFIPIQFALSKLYSKYRLQAVILGDERLNLLNEMIADMRLIKMYTWELPYAALIEKIRVNEMKNVRMYSYARGISLILAFPISKLFTSLTYLAFFLNGGQINAEIIFVTMAFSIYIYYSTINLSSLAVNLIAEILVSLKRIQDFLLLQEKENNAEKILVIKANLSENGIYMNNVTAAWKNETEPTLNEISLNMQPGELLTVLGPVGSGKTCLLMSMLGEIPIRSGNVSVKGKIAYASQEAWVFNETVRENILFGEEYDEEKYKKVLHITALDKDICLFPKGDLTIVGERGVIMSGGQKARINLARALYLDADIFLLDDPLSAVDVTVAKHIFEKCVMEYLKDKICILVTHQIQFLNSGNKILVLNKGKCEYIGNYNEMENKEMLTGISSGLQDKRIYSEIIENFQNITSKTRIFNNTEGKNLKNLSSEEFNMYVYLGFICGVVLTSLLSALLLFEFSTVASINLHNNMFRSIIRTPISFLDNNPVGNILNRFSKDVNNLDDALPFSYLLSLRGYCLLAGMCIVQVILCPYLFILTSVLSILFYVLWKIHSKVLNSIKNLEGKSRSPIFSHLSVSLYGLTTIRAFNVENKFKSTFNEYQDKHTATWFIYVALNRWVSIYGHIICFINVIITVIICSVLIDADNIGSQMGLLVNYGLVIVLNFQLILRYTSEMEFQMHSVSRILNYSKLKSEASYESSPDKKPPSDWPQKGEIHFENVSLQYSKNKNVVLQNLSFRIYSGEKIGIVGRTGAGKSSVIAALFRMTEPTGKITIDGVNIKEIGLRDLRSKISIIPQDPMLFTGLLRRNIDPFNEYSEEKLWKAIEEVQLKEVIGKLPGGLDTHLTEGGRNFSVGERQLICLARAILRQNKILVMDEATSNIDNSTDSCIQKIIREKFQSCTVLTIAHRLHTIIDSDKILVLHRGKLREFDSPYALLKNVNGFFYNLVKNTGVTSMNELVRIAKNKYYLKEIIERTKL